MARGVVLGSEEGQDAHWKLLISGLKCQDWTLVIYLSISITNWGPWYLGELRRHSHHALAHFASHRCGPSSIPGLGRGRMCEKFHQLLAIGRWFPPGAPVSSTRKLISSSSFHRLDMTLAVAEALNTDKPNQLQMALQKEQKINLGSSSRVKLLLAIFIFFRFIWIFLLVGGWSEGSGWPTFYKTDTVAWLPAEPRRGRWGLPCCW